VIFKIKNQILNIKNITFTLVIFSLALVLAACKSYQQTGTQTGGTTQESATEENQTAEGGVTISYTDDGFSPASVTVASGQAITWKNDSAETVQVGSNTHPTHTINQEITGGEFTIALAPGESKTVTVTKTGSWGYHDHLKPSLVGTVVVE